MQVKGVITIQVLDKDTLEVQNTIQQENIITEAFGSRFFPAYNGDNAGLSLEIMLSTASMKPSYYPPMMRPSSSGFSTILKTGVIVGVPEYRLIESTDSSPDIIQFSGRYNPPSGGTTRTIRTVSLVRKSVTIVGNDSESLIVAFSELETPCIQTDTQIYDIYYRILVTYDASTTSAKKEMLRIILRNLNTGSGTSNLYGFADTGTYNFYPELQPPTEDIDTVLGNNTHTGNGSYDVDGVQNSSIAANGFTSSRNKSSRPTGYRNKTRSLGFEDSVGFVLNSVDFLRYYSVSSANRYHKSYNSRIFESLPKIQNIFGYATESILSTSHPFLDVDNLATGTGTISVTGDWQNREVTSNKQLYYKTKLPERNTVKITSSGNVGASTYRYIKEKYTPISPNGIYYATPSNKHIYLPTDISHLITYTHSSFVNKSPLGNISTTFFDIQQVSASIAYDDSAILIPKKNKVLLYSIAESRYWNITGGFTNIHQLAVFNGIVYIACSVTGLYTCNPRVNLTATKVQITSPRTVDFSKCNGVCLGYSKIWAVANDALCSFDGTTWSIFDSSTTPAFGTTSSIFQTIEYIKAAENSASDQLFFVYNSSNTKIGFWWSPATPVLELNVIAGTSGRGACKHNRQHVKLCHGFVYVYTSENLIRSAFNTTTATTVISNYLGSISFELVDNLTKTDKNLATFGYSSDLDTYSFTVTTIRDNAGTTLASFNTSVYYRYSYGSTYVNGLIGQNQSGFTTPYTTVINLGGVHVLMHKSDADHFRIMINKAPYVNTTQHGGSYAYLCRDTYGWDGTQWVLDHANSRPTHATAENLLDGLQIQFNEGTSGVSFNVNNHYKFGLCEGLLKDNATRASHTTPELFAKTASGVAALSSSIVPTTTALPTGVVGIHPTHKSADAYVDGSSRVVFPGNTDGQFAVGDNQVTGDFHLTISCADVANSLVQNRTAVGIGKRHKGPHPLIGVVFTSNTNVNVFKSPNCIAAFNNAGAETVGLFNQTVTTSSVIGIKRVGTVVTITHNGVNVYTVDTTGLFSNFNKRFDVMFSTYASSNSYRSANSTCPVVTIAANGSDNAVMIGNPVAETDAYDIRCRTVVTELGAVVKLNGTIVPARFTGNDPVAGEVCIDAETLIATFNSADEGKAVEISCTRVWDM